MSTIAPALALPDTTAPRFEPIHVPAATTEPAWVRAMLISVALVILVVAAWGSGPARGGRLRDRFRCDEGRGRSRR